MSEELQSLLNRIQEDAVAKSETEAEAIINKANETAKATVAAAEESAKKLIEKAEQDAEAFKTRAEKSLAQAARDVILSIGETFNATISAIIKKDVAESMSTETVKAMLLIIAENYFKDNAGSIDVLLNSEQQQELADSFLSELAGNIKAGIELKSDDSIVSGFKVSVADEKVEHDFTSESIADALSQLLRPALGKIVKEASKSSE
jgi:V/A-type H+-transporting ATPase subunit E